MNIKLDGVRTLYNEAITMLIGSSGLGQSCTFVHEQGAVQCPNCGYDPITKRSNGIYKTSPSGSMPFAYGQLCPICAGEGKTTSTETETDTLTLVFNQKDFMYVGSVGAPVGDMQSISDISSYPKIKSADYIIPSGGDISDYRQNSYTRMSEPQFVSLGDNKYIVTNWQRGGAE